MQHLRYSANDSRTIHQNSDLFSYFVIIFFIISVLFSLFILFPKKSLITTLLNQTYITDADFHYSLQLLNRGEAQAITYQEIYHNPHKVLQQLTANMQVALAAKENDRLWFNYIVLRVMAYTRSFDRETIQQINTLMLSFFRVFLQNSDSVAQLTQLANDALAIDEHQLSFEFYGKVIKLEPKPTVYIYSRAAQVALWAKHCQQSANYYFTAKNIAANVVDKRFFYFQALKTLVQCNNAELAMTSAIKQINDLENDAQTYQLLTDIAIRAGQPKIAEQYLLKYLELKPKQ